VPAFARAPVLLMRLAGMLLPRVPEFPMVPELSISPALLRAPPKLFVIVPALVRAAPWSFWRVPPELLVIVPLLLKVPGS
jgi:hypothetical protein